MDSVDIVVQPNGPEAVDKMINEVVLHPMHQQQ